MRTEKEEKKIVIREESPDGALMDELIRLSADWEAENSCRGYRKNGRSDLEGRRFFTARDGEALTGYLFGKLEKTQRATSVLPEGTPYFEVEELYVRPAFRGGGIGKRLFSFAEEAVRKEARCILLSTATINWQGIFHFYLEELGMEFWNARLFKMLDEQGVSG